MTMVAVVYFLAGLTFVSGCGRTITAPDGVECRRGTTRAPADTVRLNDSTILAIATWCRTEGA